MGRILETSVINITVVLTLITGGLSRIYRELLWTGKKKAEARLRSRFLYTIWYYIQQFQFLNTSPSPLASASTMMGLLRSTSCASSFLERSFSM